MSRPAPTVTADESRATTIAKLQLEQRARTSQRRGNDAELVVGNRLLALGVLCLERVTTPKASRIIRGKLVTKYTKKVSGDWRGVGPGGRSVLVEVKARPDRLRLSDLAPHQRASLQAHLEAGGYSLVAFVSTYGIYLLHWPLLQGFSSLSWKEAQANQLTQLE